MASKQVEIIAEHYLNACIWADKPEGTNPRITQQAKNKALEIANDFVKWVKFEQLPEGYYLDQLGHDLYLTSQGHGAGFWDRKELGETLGDYLTTLSKKYDRVYPEFYRGWLYLHGEF